MPDLSFILGPAKGPKSVVADKVVHFSSYAILVLAMAWAYRPTAARRTLWWIVGLAGVHAVLTEVAQLASPHREFSLLDMAANWAGVALAAVVCVLLSRRCEGPT